jgi:hypothetical protein
MNNDEYILPWSGGIRIPQELLKTIYTNRDLFTLCWLIIIIIVFPLFERSAVGNILLVFLFSILLLSVLYDVSDHPRQVAIGLLLAIPLLLSAWTNVFLPSHDTLIAEVMATAVFLCYILVAILKRVFAAREVTITEIYRAVNVYLMIALTFGMVYLLIDLLEPGSFQFPYGEHTLSAIFYFSFGVLTTGGVGDIIATGPLLHSVVTIELVIGVMYMAVFIGLLVNAHYSNRYSSGTGGERAGAGQNPPGTSPAPIVVPAVRRDPDTDSDRGHDEPRHLHHHGSPECSHLPGHMGNLAGRDDRRFCDRCLRRYHLQPHHGIHVLGHVFGPLGGKQHPCCWSHILFLEAGLG